MGAVVAIGAGLGEGPVVLRAVALYAAMLTILRLAGKRTVGEMTAFDLVLLMMVSEFTQTTVLDSDSSPAVGVLAIVALVGMDIVMGWATWRSRALDRVLDGAPLRGSPKRGD